MCVSRLRDPQNFLDVDATCTSSLAHVVDRAA
jgi:hypothetical protein